VLRVDRDGRPAPGNHTPAGGDPRIYTYGHRNVQGLTFRPSTGQPFMAEHGPNHTDEVTPLVVGGNGGWEFFSTHVRTRGEDYDVWLKTVDVTQFMPLRQNYITAWWKARDAVVAATESRSRILRPLRRRSQQTHTPQ
jgi:glucose/arabinose dehydrogenase